MYSSIGFRFSVTSFTSITTNLVKEKRNIYQFYSYVEGKLCICTVVLRFEHCSDSHCPLEMDSDCTVFYMHGGSKLWGIKMRKSKLYEGNTVQFILQSCKD